MFCRLRFLCLLLLGLALPALLQAAPMRVAYPQQVTGYTAGYEVDPRLGRLGMCFPVATVPGEIPIPVAFRYNTTFEETSVGVWHWLPVFAPGHTAGDPPIRSEYQLMPGSGTLRRPIIGSLHFGFITNAEQIFLYGGSEATHSPYCFRDAVYVLEDGTEYTDEDFLGFAPATGSSTFNLPPAFGFAKTLSALSSLRVTAAGTLARFDANLADLGSLASTVQSVAPYASAFKVLMDRDRARIFAYQAMTGSWTPVLWADRFGHYVTFKWQSFGGATSAPVYAVTVLNQRGKGCQVQWLAFGASTSSIAPLLRVDFINMQAPSLLATGYFKFPDNPLPSGSLFDANSTEVPSVHPMDIGGPALRPKELRIGDPAGLATSWLALAKPAVAGSAPWPADRVWTFDYDANLAEVSALHDLALGLTTTFSYQDSYIPESGFDGRSTRSVLTAISQDTALGTLLSKTWTYALPSGSNPWQTTYSQSYTGGATQYIQAPTKTRYTYAGPADPNYGNGILKTTEILDAAGEPLSTETYTNGQVGYDGSLSVATQVETKTKGAPTRTILTIMDPEGPGTLPKQTITKWDSEFDAEMTGYAYEKRFDLLDPGRVTYTTHARRQSTLIFNAWGDCPALSDHYIYDPVSYLPTKIAKQVVLAGADNLGQNLVYDTQGRVISSSNFADFSTSGIQTKKTVYNPSSGLPDSVQTIFDTPAGSDSYTERWNSYDSCGRPTSYTDGLGITTTTSYDAWGRVLKVQKMGAPTLEYAYPSLLQTVTTTKTIDGTAIVGQATTETRDAFGRLIKRERGSGGVTETFLFDNNGRAYSLIESRYHFPQEPPPGITTFQRTLWTRVYDDLGRVVSEQSLNNPAVSYSYLDENSHQVIARLFTATSGESYTTRDCYDLWGNVVKSTDPVGKVTKSQYDGMGHLLLTNVSDGTDNGQFRQYQYSPLGFLISRTEPEGSSFFDQFNAQGLPALAYEGLSSSNNPSAGYVRARTRVYDGLGRLRSETGGTESRTFNYAGLKAISAQTKMGTAATSVAYGYDGWGRLTSEGLTPSWSTTTAWTIGYSYDPAGRLQNLTYPDGRNVQYQYAEAAPYFGRVSNVILQNRTSSQTLASVYYDFWGNRQSLTFGSGASSRWLPDFTGQHLKTWAVTPKTGSAIVRSYDYDGRNFPKTADDWSLQHDNAGHLLEADRSDLSQTFMHDVYDNNISSVATGTVPNGFNNYTFSKAPINNANLLALNEVPTKTVAGGQTGWTFNNAGDATSMWSAVGSLSGPSFAWDGLGRLKSATGGGTTQSYGYYPTGLRSMLVDAATPANNRSYVYTSSGQLLAEYAGATSACTLKHDVIYLANIAIAEIDESGVIHELHCDNLGTPRTITNGSTGAVEGTQNFAPFGELISATGTYKPITGFTGHLQADPMTGLIYMKGRYYTPAWHRFINSNRGRDPLLANQFSYVGGSPFRATDPTGLDRSYIIDPLHPEHIAGCDGDPGGNYYLYYSFFGPTHNADGTLNKSKTEIWNLYALRQPSMGVNGETSYQVTARWEIVGSIDERVTYGWNFSLSNHKVPTMSEAGNIGYPGQSATEEFANRLTGIVNEYAQSVNEFVNGKWMDAYNDGIGAWSFGTKAPLSQIVAASLNAVMEFGMAPILQGTTGLLSVQGAQDAMMNHLGWQINQALLSYEYDLH